MSLVLPQRTLDLVNRTDARERHPGLQLDKLSVSGDQKAQRDALEAVCHVSGDRALLETLNARRIQTLGLLSGVSTCCCETTGPLTLHLSRASALENAGICLHPLYGFAYLPGSGLKGMARAYAETVWFPAQDEPREAWRLTEAVFGWAPSSDLGKHWKPEGIPKREKGDDARVGGIVFHDAWPVKWPDLFVDIVNNHHPQYYGNDDGLHPPGDWENPVPVYFLAVKPGTKFVFALSKCRPEVPDDLNVLARQWLLGALCHLGAGAKTNAGYGAFRIVDGVDVATAEAVGRTWRSATGSAAGEVQRAVCETTLELTAPAFLAGADQYGPAAREDCDLRPATLRGHLRWWWRTMHAGFLDVRVLRALEAAVWGDTHASGAVRILVENTGVPADRRVSPYDKRSKANFDEKRKNSRYGIVGADSRKTTQGLWYASYGMDESGRNGRRQRHVLEPPASWRLRLIARPTRFYVDRADAADPEKCGCGRPLTAEQSLEQALAAVWLLCRFGAVGSKARKGFGSVAAPGLDGWTVEKCRETGRRLRETLELSGDFDVKRGLPASLHCMLDPIDVAFSWANVWDILDQIGFAYQALAKKLKHKAEKKALGLPRRIGAPVQGVFRPAEPIGDRHASPVHIHIDRDVDGWRVRAVAFPAARLPDAVTSRKFLSAFLRDFGEELRRRASLPPPVSGPGQAPPAQAAQPSAGCVVEATLLDERTKRGGWKARHEGSGLSGPIQNSADVPGDKKAGDVLTLFVVSVSRRQIDFRYPTAEEKRRSPNDSKGGKGGPPRGLRG